MKLVAIGEIPKVMSSLPTDLVEIYKVCRHMEIVCEQEGGAGLAASQVGIPWAVYIVKEDDHYQAYIDCSYTSVGDDKIESIEGCLSLKGENGFRTFKLERFKRIKLKGKKLISEKEVQDIEVEIEGMMAIVHQHEIQHSQGILISDIGKEVYLWR